MILLLATGVTAWAGYGDADDGVPTHAEREVHVWTNMVRVDPEAFADDYPCNFNSWSNSERTPKTPLLWHSGLNEAAHDHSEDMNDEDYFSHDSIDGTPWNVRIARYYPSGFVGENIAWGYGSPYSAVIDGWMCSSGHRSNIMSTSYDELGTGVDGTYYTQDFGYRDADPYPIAMGVHLPADPGTKVDFVADFYTAIGNPPAAFDVVLDGVRHPLDLTIGTDSRGGWRIANVDVSRDECHSYFFEAELLNGEPVRFPEDGSYGWGPCPYDDAKAGWIDGQIEPEPEHEPGETTDTEPGLGTAGTPGQPADDGELTFDGGVSSCGCAATSSGLMSWLTLPALVGLIARRRLG